jgi:hypothetical protein
MNITDTVLIAAIKGLVPGLLVGAVILLTASQCGPPPGKDIPNPAIVRYTDEEAGVVCWTMLANGISCLPLDETRLGE